MPFYVVAYEQPNYFYRTVEAANWTEAYQKAANETDLVDTTETESEIERTADYDSGPWSTAEKAALAVDEGRYGQSDISEGQA